MKVTFGLPEIISAFGCYALIQSNFLVGSILLSAGILGAVLRIGMEQQEKKESSQKIEQGLKSLKDAFLTPKTPWDVSDKNVH